jgi:hypothetical protein
MLFTVLSTGASAFLAAVCLYALYRCLDAGDRAERASRRLERLNGQVLALESTVGALSTSHRKLQGRFHAAKAKHVADADEFSLAAPNSGDADDDFDAMLRLQSTVK